MSVRNSKEGCLAEKLAVQAYGDVATLQEARLAGSRVIATPMVMKHEICKRCRGACQMERDEKGQLYLQPPSLCISKNLHPGDWHILKINTTSSVSRPGKTDLSRRGRDRKRRPRFH